MAYDETKDPYAGTAPSLAFFGTRGVPISPSDTEDLNPYPKTVFVGTGGTVKFIPVGNEDDEPLTLPFPDGAIIPWRVRRIFANGTDAEDLATIEG